MEQAGDASGIHKKSPLEHTGERMVPHASDPIIFWEHIDRHRFASSFTRGKNILDVACGEGYGSAALLRTGARTVIGIDVARETVEHDRCRFNTAARVGNAEPLSLTDGRLIWLSP